MWSPTGEAAVKDSNEHFERNRGTGFMATADKDGEVNIAVYSRRRVMEDGTLEFGMTDRLTHKNLQDSPKAACTFQEHGFQGVGICLGKVRGKTNGAVFEEICRGADQVVGAATGKKLVTSSPIGWSVE
ncbi:MAG: pyridoxamine 5'-phosphate oxidase family protein [Deferrisomatales bacterium]|nr:pyridoxamine 5'-phosphate oxidase family protein [Deferrisomatales bacterium]